MILLGDLAEGVAGADRVVLSGGLFGGGAGLGFLLGLLLGEETLFFVGAVDFVLVVDGLDVAAVRVEIPAAEAEEPVLKYQLRKRRSRCRRVPVSKSMSQAGSKA